MIVGHGGSLWMWHMPSVEMEDDVQATPRGAAAVVRERKALLQHFGQLGGDAVHADHKRRSYVDDVCQLQLAIQSDGAAELQMLQYGLGIVDLTEAEAQLLYHSSAPSTSNTATPGGQACASDAQETREQPLGDEGGDDPSEDLRVQCKSCKAFVYVHTCVNGRCLKCISGLSRKDDAVGSLTPYDVRALMRVPRGAYGPTGVDTNTCAHRC